MLKYVDIIKRLSDSEKIRVLCDSKCLSEKNFRALGIPELSLKNLDDFAKGDYPSAFSLANTWNPTLIRQVADDLSRRATASFANFVKVPAPRIKINPYRQGVSEDPMLASAVSGAYMEAAQRLELAVGLPGFGLHADEIEWLDSTPDERCLYDYFTGPYKELTQNKKCAAILTAEDLSDVAYGNVNNELAQSVVHQEISAGAVPICARVSAEHTVAHLLGGGLCIEGSVTAVESALSKYKKLTDEIARGRCTEDELAMELAQGTAISPEELDEALDRKLAFVFSLKRKSVIAAGNPAPTLALQAAEGATVLLKNENAILPIKKSKKIAIVGDLALGDEQEAGIAATLQQHLEKEGMVITGQARGYDAKTERSEELLHEALALASDSDMVLLFLGIPEEKAQKAYKTKRLTLPANQQELLDQLGPWSHKIVAIMHSDFAADVCFPERCAAMLLSPYSVKCGAQALTNVLLGRVSPGGRLSNTLYSNTEQQYVKFKTYRERDKIRTGSFIGYRYYDTAEDLHAFPFGYGLGYAKVTYTSVHVKDRTVRVELKNQSKVSAVEVVQVYVGKSTANDAHSIRPKKELSGFARVELKAGEKKTVEIPFTVPYVYDTEKNRPICESGEYTVFVGSSVQDIKQSRTITVSGELLSASGEDISRYIHSRTNIILDNYKLEAKYKAMKRSVFNFIAGALALVLAILLKVFCATNDLQHAFFNWFTVILAVGGIGLFIVEAIRRNKITSHEQEIVDKLNTANFEQAEQIPVYSAPDMFAKEFDATEPTESVEAVERIEGVETEYLQYIDKEQSFARAAAEFELYAMQRGCKFRTDVTKKVFAALASSKLVVVDGMSDEQLSTFMKMLCGYFGTDLFVDYVDETYQTPDRVLFGTDFSGMRERTNAALAIDSARNHHHTMHFIGLNNVKADMLPAYFAPFANYVKNPQANNHFVIMNDWNFEVSYYIPPNVWFILNLSAEDSADRLPEMIKDVASVNRFEYDDYSIAEQPDEVSAFSYYQMDYLAERAANHYHVDEDAWKRLDRFEEMIGTHVPFHIGNKLFLCLERYAYVYLASGGNMAAAVDEALAAKLINPVIACLEGCVTPEEINLAEMIESILGEDRAEACKKVIGAYNSRKA